MSDDGRLLILGGTSSYNTNPQPIQPRIDTIAPPSLTSILSGTTTASANADYVAAFQKLALQLSEPEPKKVQQLVAAQLPLLQDYHRIVQAQSSQSFWWALIGSGIALSFFIAAVPIAWFATKTLAPVAPLFSGAVVAAISGFVFHLYGRASEQMNVFHSRLETWQRYLLANSLCESLDPNERGAALTTLIYEILRGPTNLIDPTNQPLDPSGRSSAWPGSRAGARLE